MSQKGDLQAAMAQFSYDFRSLADNVHRVIMGAERTVRLALLCLVAEGHLLIEDVPGVGKTSLARSIAASVGIGHNRIQFTPDLLPSDVTGVPVYYPSLEDFRFRRGPIFANIVICDEVNRASPKAQSALLEVMEERRVSVDGNSHPVPTPFMVMATQNPITFAGTYPLLEAQLDRFLLRLNVGYPGEADEVRILKQEHERRLVPEDLMAVLSIEDLQRMISDAKLVRVSDSIHHYIVALSAGTRKREKDVQLGASPRASLALMRAARVLAASDGRYFVVPEDVKALAVPVFAHRIMLTEEASLRGTEPEDIVQRVVEETRAPR